MLIRQYLAPDGYRRLAAELHERGDDRRRRRLGQDARLHRQLHHRQPAASPATSIAAPARAARRTPCSAPARCTAASPSAPRRSAAWSAPPTAPWSPTNLWGERWSKLVANVMGNGLSACTGLVGRRDAAERRDPPLLDPARQRGDPRRPGAGLSARGDPAPAARDHRAGRRGRRGGDARRATSSASRTAARSAAEQRPSMGQDMLKGRRTEIEFLNGYVVREGEKVGIAAPRQRRADRHRQARREGRAASPTRGTSTELRLN